MGKIGAKRVKKEHYSTVTEVNLRKHFKTKLRRTGIPKQPLGSSPYAKSQDRSGSSSVKPLDKHGKRHSIHKEHSATPTRFRKTQEISASLEQLGKHFHHRSTSLSTKSNSKRNKRGLYASPGASRVPDNGRSSLNEKKPGQESYETMKNLDFKLDVAIGFEHRKDFEEAKRSYNELFSEIIRNDNQFGGFLQRIRDFSESLARREEGVYLTNTEALAKEVNGLLETIKKEDAKYKQLERGFRKTNNEIADLSRDLETTSTKYNDLREQFLKISELNLKELPQDDKSWKFLVAENKNYLALCKKLRKDNKQYKSKEKKLVKLILAVKARGYPIEEIYEEDVQQPKETTEEYSENEYLIDGPPRAVRKPEIVPILPIVQLTQPETSSKSSSVSSFY